MGNSCCSGQGTRRQNLGHSTMERIPAASTGRWRRTDRRHIARHCQQVQNSVENQEAHWNRQRTIRHAMGQTRNRTTRHQGRRENYFSGIRHCGHGSEEGHDSRTTVAQELQSRHRLDGWWPPTPSRHDGVSNQRDGKRTGATKG